ncbi:MAG: NAD(P)-dependent alcohol dehydrogenase [Bacilli bacterium]|nr:NAD(P)-dependent alcohol dehydrogenase [Bacilli bacterium]
MKAIIQKTYGGPELLEMVETPVPSLHEKSILIEIYVSNIASGDMRVNTLDVPFGLKTIFRLMFGWKGPKKQIRGLSGSGKVIEVGTEVKRFKKDDLVYFINSMGAGSLAEYIVLTEKSIMAHIPENFSYEEAAPLAFGAMSAYHFINGKNIKDSDKVLILGASGSVGTYALQLSKYYGNEVTAVCSKKNHPQVLSLGADHVIDYHTTDFSTIVQKYDVIFDAVGRYKKKMMKRNLSPNGKYLSIKTPTKEAVERLEAINKIIEEGKLQTVIDKVYPLNDYEEAHKHVYSKHKVGNVLLDIKK